ncbi:MAG: hypothetical protein QNJ03_00090 [Dinoroseobacter sp.]|nr:hypothetical protein [Dinoroseobacter sp.]
MAMIKVCVRIPEEKQEELKTIAKAWRDMSVYRNRDAEGENDMETLVEERRGPGWDAKVIHRIAREKFGGLKEMFEAHDWPERGSEMMRAVQRRVKEHYGSIDSFKEKNEL